MGYLKYEMRNMFEKKTNLGLLGPQTSFDEGIIRQIAYLSFLNPNVFPNLNWKVLCIKSYAAKNKIFTCCSAKQSMEDCAAALVFYNDSNVIESEKDEYYNNLLKVSIMYSCRLNHVDYEIIDIKNEEILKNYFKLSDNSNIKLIISLGFFNNVETSIVKRDINYENTVKEV